MSDATHATRRRPLPRTAPRTGRLRAWIDRADAGPWTRTSVAIAAVALGLVVIGLVMTFSASFVDAAETGDPFGTFRRQLVWALIALPVFLLVSSVDHRLWRPVSWTMIGASVVGLVIVLLPSLGLSEGGSTRWIAVGPLVVQPSELAKLASLLWLADVLARKRPPDGHHSLAHLLIPAVPLLVLEALLVMLQPDLGTTVLLAVIVLLVVISEGLPLRHVLTAGAIGTTFVAIAAWAAPYRFARITSWLDPEADPLGQGYQLLQSLYALGSGGWFGTGLGAGRAKWNFVPNPETDFVFSIIGEELGFIGAAGVIVMFVVLLYLGLSVARRAEGFGRTVAFAISGWVAGQALVNIGAVTGLLPITGVTLPLVSVGGSSLIVTMIALGILVSIARSADRVDAPRVAPRRPR